MTRFAFYPFCLLALAGCDRAVHRAAGEARLGRVADNAMADEQRIDAGIEANIRAAAAANAADDLVSGAAADQAFLDNLDAERNASVEAIMKNSTDRAKRAQFDETMRAALPVANEQQP